MKLRNQYIYRYILLVLCILPIGVQAQRIVRVDVDSVACPGDSVFIGVGLDYGNEVVIQNLQTAVSHPGRTFLPDGVPCGNLGCSYRSPVNFSGFAPDAVITSVNDINYVRLNIEHSWLGDIYIDITCPNGQKASLMNYSNNGSSECTSTIPSSHLGWSSTYTNANTSTYLGQPYDYGASGNSKCDSTNSMNAPGTGWNYCWSNNTANGYSYAPYDGFIYRSANVSGNSIRASNPATGTNFYHPNQSFTSLIGCPINGDWYIEVIDGWSGDNGYIFDWELSLNPSFVPSAGHMTGLDVLGDVVTPVSDSTFLVSAPAGTTSDTTVFYTVRIFCSTGDTLDTVVSVHYTEAVREVYRQNLCAGDTLRIDTLVITEDLQRIDSFYTDYGCLSIKEYDITFSPRYWRYDTVGFCYGADMIYNDSTYPGAGNYVLPHMTAEGCDSNTYVTLVILDSGFRAAPLISDDAEIWRTDTMLAGCVPLTVWMKDTTLHVATQKWGVVRIDEAGGDTLWLSGDSLSHDFDTAGHYTLIYVAMSENGCLDTLVLNDAVWVFENPTAEFTWAPEKPVMSHPTAEFINLSRPDSLSFLWLIQTTAGEDSLHDAAPTYTWEAEGEYIHGDFRVLLTAVQTYTGPYGLPVECEDTVSATITIVNDWLQFPNLVTPNGDGTNDIWKVVNLLECGEYSMNELWIFNRWGVLVYHAQNIRREEDFWNPDETDSPDGTYYFRFSAKSMHGIVRTNGPIEVVR